MGLLNCFGLRTKSYNAKKYELNTNKKDKNKKKRVSTDSFGVADTNVHPQLIEETGGDIHPITSDILNESKDSNENVCQLTDNQKNEINHKEDNQKADEQVVTKEEQTDDKHPANDYKLNHELTQESHQKDITDNQTVADHQIHSTSDHNTSVGYYSGNQSHSTDQNTVSMDTSYTSGGGGATESSGGGADSSTYD